MAKCNEWECDQKAWGKEMPNDVCFLLSRSQAGCQSRQIRVGADQPGDLD